MKTETIEAMRVLPTTEDAKRFDVWTVADRIAFAGSMLAKLGTKLGMSMEHKIPANVSLDMIYGQVAELNAALKEIEEIVNPSPVALQIAA